MTLGVLRNFDFVYGWSKIEPLMKGMYVCHAYISGDNIELVKVLKALLDNLDGLVHLLLGDDERRGETNTTEKDKHALYEKGSRTKPTRSRGWVSPKPPSI